jgi:alpha-galactosidase
MMAAPLIAGNDVIHMPKNIREILVNPEVIAVDQDPLGQQGVAVWKDGQGLVVYSKKLQENDTRAVALFNRTDKDETITVQWKDIGIPEGRATVRDLWMHSDLGTYGKSYTGYVHSHEVVLLKVVGENE